MIHHSHYGAPFITLLDALFLSYQPKTKVLLATAAALPSGTYANGTSGVGATFSVTATGTLTVDGVVTALNDRILVQNQVTGYQNGIYVVTTAGATGVAAVLTRDVASDTSAEVFREAVAVIGGTVNAKLGFANTNASAPTLGSTAITYAPITPVAGSTVAAATASQARAATSTAVQLTPANLQDEVLPQVLTDAATVAFDVSLGKNATLTIAGNRTLGNPTNLFAGAKGKITITQGASGSHTLAYGNAYLWAGGTPGVLSTAAAAIDGLDWYSPDGTHVHLSLAKAFA